MNNLFDKTGVMAIGTRLRMLSERMSEDAEKMFELYDVDIKQKWYPVVFSLSQDSNPKTVTEIANEIGQSHVSVLKIIREMSKAGMLIEKKDKTDGRKTNISLSDSGKEKIVGLDNQHSDVTIAVQNMLSGMEYNLWHALEEFESLLDEKSTYPRVLDVQRKRESSNVKIVDFEDKYAKDFKEFNKQWIDRYFEMEEKDKNILDHPKKYILDEGGVIIVAIYDNKVAGFCGLMKSEDKTYDYELTKMTVKPEFQGKGIGLNLGTVIINKARHLGAKSIFLQSNTVLNQAITLYKKLGFKKVIGYSKPYERSNIQMSLILK